MEGLNEKVYSTHSQGFADRLWRYDHDRRRGRLGQDEPEPAEADDEAGAAVTNAAAWGTWGGSIPGAVAGADHL
ncbi:hypothetical protein PF005_g22922 [Phytophthora fragariae]|nr:hypothetical protein PF003_g26281 [Phytophthora fragariae]KAE9181350.1 hypothetical protein PF005_g22922 [Phytophthora fragariae]KAE9284174.1 hypothetical protein PF001_g22516 [Phytophthora fragariae]